MALPEKQGGREMLTLEIYGKLIKWPEDFARLMMKYYENHGVPFIVHRDCINTGKDSSTNGFVAKCAATAETQANICCHQQS
jgi:hypothetical protein